MNVLVACEESGVVCSAFRNKGHEAWSCDLKPTSGLLPQFHIQDDCLYVINNHNWDLIIAHPPCTYLSNVASPRLFNNRDRYLLGLQAKEFFLKIYNSDCPKICIENPVPNKSFNLPSYSQIIQPYEFGDSYKKRTCLWLKNLPYLLPSCVGFSTDFPSWTMKCRSAEMRSKTFPGIALAMANQWG